MRASYSQSDDVHIRKRMLEALADRRDLIDAAGELAEEMNRTAIAILLRWYTVLSNPDERKKSPVERKRKPWSTRLQVEQWALLDALSSELNMDKTQVFEIALDLFVSNLDDDARDRVKQEQRAILAQLREE